jgi:NAD-dependent SIR2 family protein deacetylase
VYNVPQYTYFNHSIHIGKGVGCVECHGQVDEMPLMRQAQTLQMSWCLNCHRDPQGSIRPKSEVFNLHWQPDEDQRVLGQKLVDKYHVQDSQSLTSCSTCHR